MAQRSSTYTALGGATPAVLSPRDFNYIKPKGRRLSEYEAVTCYTQPDPEAFDVEGWFLLGPGPEYRTAWRRDSTKLTYPDWFEFRDPAMQWQRTYVRMQAEQERAIERVTEDAVVAGALHEIDEAWLRNIIAPHYRTWAFVEYGVFRTFGVAQREALSDTLGNVLCFQAFDHMRHAQAIVLWLMALEENGAGVRDEGAKERWLEDPIYQPLRRLTEQLMLDTDDWAECAVATNLVIAPLVAEVGLSQLVRRPACRHGDAVTALICSTVERDRRRNLAYCQELVQMVVREGVPERDRNHEVIQGWLDDWAARAIEAILPLEPLYDLVPLEVISFGRALATAAEAQRTLIKKVGFTPSSMGDLVGDLALATSGAPV